MHRSRRVVVASVAGFAAIACVTGIIASGSSTLGSVASALTFTTTTAPTTTTPTTFPWVTPDETELYLSDAQVIEGDTNNPVMKFSVRLPLQAHAPALFHALVSNGTASSDDYVNPGYQGYIIPVGSSETFINVPIKSDLIDEPNETIIVTLGGTLENATILRGQATGTIIDDDGGDIPATTTTATTTTATTSTSTASTTTTTVPPPVPSKTISINDATTVEGGRAKFTVTLSEKPTQPTSVSFSTAELSASAAADYGHKTNVLTFKKGQTTKTIFVRARKDKVTDPGEEFMVVLLGPSAGWTIERPVGIGTIT